MTCTSAVNEIFPVLTLQKTNASRAML